MIRTRLGPVGMLLVGVAAFLVAPGCVSSPDARGDGGGGGGPGPSGGGGGLRVSEAVYGLLPDGRVAHVWTLTNGSGMRVRLCDFGAAVLGVEVPDRKGRISDVTLGYETLADRRSGGFLLGTTADRGDESELGKRLWKGKKFATGGEVGVELSLRRTGRGEAGPAGPGGPGGLDVTVRYWLTDANLFGVRVTATTDEPASVNLSHRTYWNLAGVGPGDGDVLGHELTVHAERYTPLDDGRTPTGAIALVKGTPMDFSSARTLREGIGRMRGGYDHTFVLRGPLGSVRQVARLRDPGSGRTMELLTDQPCLRLETGDRLDGSVRGKGGVRYRKHGGLRLASESFPDVPVRSDLAPAPLRPGETYRHTLLHRFSTR